MACGVYSIVCTKNKRMYIGSSNNLPRRKSAHFSGLRRGTHPNEYMQRAFDKYGESEFSWQILEILPGNPDEKSLCDAEQVWIDKFWESGLLFNVNQRAESAGRKASEETRMKLKMIRSSPEFAKRASELRLGRKHSDETKRKLSEAQNRPDVRAGKSARSKLLKHTDEAKEKIRIAASNMSAESLEKRRRTKSSQEYKSRDSAIRASKEYKDKFSKMIGRRMTDDRLRKHIEMMKTEEYREKVSSALKGKKKSAQSIEKMILTKKARKAERSGPNAYNAAFDKEEVKQIRDRASSGESNASIARDFGVSRNCIRGVVTFKTYSSF